MPAASPRYVAPWTRPRGRTALGASSGIAAGSNVTGPMSTVAAATTPSARRDRGRPSAGRRRCRRRAGRARRGPSRARDPGEAAHRRCRSSRRCRRRRCRASSSQSAPSAPGPTMMQAVGADAAVAVAERRDERAVAAASSGVERGRHQEVVAGGVELRELGHRADASPASSIARTAASRPSDFARGAEPGDPGIAPEPHALAAGELAGAASRPRRARRRGELEPSRCASDLLVADGLARRCATARRAGAASAADLVDEPGVAHRGEARRRCAREVVHPASQTPAIAHREHGRAVGGRGRARTTRTAGR